MKSVLISIKPKWCELIVQGKKTIEVRKTVPNLKTPFKCYIYCTKNGIGKEINGCLVFQFDKENVLHDVTNKIGNGKVIGEFVCDTIYEFPFSWENFTAYGIKTYRGFEKRRKETCLSIKEIDIYANSNGHTERLFGWHISDLKIYDKPKELSEFKKKVFVENCCLFGKFNARRYSLEALKRPPQSWCYVEGMVDE